MRSALLALALLAPPLLAQAPHDVLDRAKPKFEGEALQREVKALLEQPLARDTALRLAALNNPRLRSTFTELDLAEADLIQAGLIPNPVFSGVAKRSTEGTKSEFSLSQELVALFTRGLRKKIAARQLDQARLQVAAVVLNFEAAVKEAFIAFQGAQQEVELRRAILDVTDAGLELARRQRQAGNISQLMLDTQTAAEAQQRLELAQSELREKATREALNRLMGLSGDQTRWTVTRELPALPPSDPKPEGLESYAIGHRFDLALARSNREVVAEALRLAQRTRFFTSVSVGVNSEKDPGMAHLIGPLIDLELPIFNRKQGEIARLEAQGQQVDSNLMGLAIDIRSQAREAYARLSVARATATYYRDTLVPLRQRVVEESQLHYNAMLLGVYDLIRAKQDRNEAAKGYLDALRDYWISRFELERVLGGSLPNASEETPR
jgi:cobalt-zinc-cadmium efflux system outer membrane protein